MEQKRGAKTSEFWFASVSALFIALMGLLVGYGMITSEQSDLWIGLFIAALPIALAGISVGYSNSRAKAKSQ